MELAQGYRLQDERMTMELLYDITEIKQNDIYIYGAGMVAELLTVEIKNTSNILIHAYAVTQYPCGMDSINGIPVISVDYIPENAAVVIATLLDSHEEMRLSPERHHTGVCYAVSEIMFRNMRKKYVSESVDKASKKLRLNEMRRLSETDWEGLIICDEMLPHFLGKTKNIEIISSGQFMEETDMACEYKRIFVLLIDWSGNWKELIHKLFTTQAEIILSYRYKYLRLTELNLIDEAKKQGFQLSGQKRFDRDRREFYTEDVLLRFQKRTSVTLRNDRLCTGCGKCTLECPAGALHMETDVYGYKKPVCDKEKCISCNHCVESCPAYKTKESDWNNVNCYAYMAQDAVRTHSSSGGAFGVAAGIFLQNGGYVCGAAWNKDFTVSHKIINAKRNLPELQMSKYVKSDITKVLPIVKELLQSDEKVLFVGCPCQVAAVKEYVGKNAEKLVTIDLVCADAPAQQIFSKYLSENYEVRDIKEIGFRDKETGWRPDAFYVVEEDGKKKLMHMEDLCQRAFHSRLLMSVCCEHCNFITYPREGDLTLGDAWGVTAFAPHLNDGKGTSIVLINTEKGGELYKKIE